MRLQPVLSVLPMALLLTSACGDKTGDANHTSGPGGVFGGSGGVIEARPTAGQGALGGSGGSAGSDAVAPDVCDQVPQGSVARLDDFNDGDSVAVPEADREAYWFTVHDDSGGTLEPANAFLPVPGGVDGTLAAHITAADFTIWGAAFVANISHETGVRCPYNASRFAGLRFVAKGHGTVRAQLGMPGIIEKEFGGSCDPDSGQICYDFHGKFITLTADYQTYELPWSDFQQRNFGRQVPFDPATIFSLQFSFETADLPVDFWLDNVELWDGVPDASSGACGAGGVGAGGAGAGAGGAGAGAGAGDAAGGASGGADLSAGGAGAP